MLELTNISAAYGMSRVLYGIDMSVGAGEVVTLLGRNGAGKTTLLRTIVGVHERAEGTITFNSCDITGMRTYQRARQGIGYVPQGRGIFPHFTVEQNLRMGFGALTGREKRGTDAVPDHVYDLFPALQRLRDRNGGVLSGGEQQQLAIARALVTEPKLLILDEPTEGIQPSIVQQIYSALQIIRKELKISILLVEQFLDFVWTIADRFYVMRRGGIADQGSTCSRTQDSIVHLLTV